jgi:hypothetical protein
MWRATRGKDFRLTGVTICFGALHIDGFDSIQNCFTSGTVARQTIRAKSQAAFS